MGHFKCPIINHGKEDKDMSIIDGRYFACVLIEDGLLYSQSFSHWHAFLGVCCACSIQFTGYSLTLHHTWFILIIVTEFAK